jgi:hypothetical protein
MAAPGVGRLPTGGFLSGVLGMEGWIWLCAFLVALAILFGGSDV